MRALWSSSRRERLPLARQSRMIVLSKAAPFPKLRGVFLKVESA